MSETTMTAATGRVRAAKEPSSSAGFAFPPLEMPKFEMPDGFRDVAVQWVDQGKKNFDTVIAAAEEVCETCGKTWSTTARCTADCAAKLTEAVHKNTDAAFDLAHSLMAAKSVPEILAISAAGARRQFQVLASQNQELWSLAQEAVVATMRPFAAAVPKAFQMPAAS